MHGPTPEMEEVCEVLDCKVRGCAILGCKALSHLEKEEEMKEVVERWWRWWCPAAGWIW